MIAGKSLQSTPESRNLPPVPTHATHSSLDTLSALQRAQFIDGFGRLIAADVHAATSKFIYQAIPYSYGVCSRNLARDLDVGFAGRNLRHVHTVRLALGAIADDLLRAKRPYTDW